jgi:hypothetical protein
MPRPVGVQLLEEIYRSVLVDKVQDLAYARG